MHSHHLLLEEPIRMASILEPSKPSFFPAMTKIVGTLGPRSRSVETISSSKQRERTAALLCYLYVFFLHRQQTARMNSSLTKRHSHHLLLEEPIRMASILEPSKPRFFPGMTKIVGTLDPRSRSVETISSSKQQERTAALLCYLCVFFLHRQQTARTDSSLA
ncbi:hypothetical protein Ccrd_000870, partial [Cynara cardunculus var. scolymus]